MKNGWCAMVFAAVLVCCTVSFALAETKDEFEAEMATLAKRVGEHLDRIDSAQQNELSCLRGSHVTAECRKVQEKACGEIHRSSSLLQQDMNTMRTRLQSTDVYDKEDKEIYANVLDLSFRVMNLVLQQLAQTSVCPQA